MTKAIQPIQQASQPVELDAATRQTLTDALAASKAPATRRAYKTAWNAWKVWADTHGQDVVPVQAEAVAGYLAQRFNQGAGLATLRMATVAAIQRQGR